MSGVRGRVRKLIFRPLDNRFHDPRESTIVGRVWPAAIGGAEAGTPI